MDFWNWAGLGSVGGGVELVAAGMQFVIARVTEAKAAQRSVFLEEVPHAEIAALFTVVSHLLIELRKDLERMCGAAHYRELLVRTSILTDNWVNPKKYRSGMFLPSELNELGQVVDWHFRLLGNLKELARAKRW
jgi:hypothetical protein